MDGAPGVERLLEREAEPSTGAFLSTGGTWTNNSDVNLKRDFEAVGPREVLSRVAALPLEALDRHQRDAVGAAITLDRGPYP